MLKDGPWSHILTLQGHGGCATFCFFAFARLAAGAQRFLVDVTGNVTGDVTGREDEEGA